MKDDRNLKVQAALDWICYLLWLIGAQLGVTEDLGYPSSPWALRRCVTQQIERALRQLRRLGARLLPRRQFLRQKLSHLDHIQRTQQKDIIKLVTKMHNYFSSIIIFHVSLINSYPKCKGAFIKVSLFCLLAKYLMQNWMDSSETPSSSTYLCPDFKISNNFSTKKIRIMTQKILFSCK